jgi:hypothetical protein
MARQDCVRVSQDALRARASRSWLITGTGHHGPCHRDVPNGLRVHSESPWASATPSETAPPATLLGSIASATRAAGPRTCRGGAGAPRAGWLPAGLGANLCAVRVRVEPTRPDYPAECNKNKLLTCSALRSSSSAASMTARS